MVCVTSYAQENQDTNVKENSLWTSSRPDGHAPISVMGDHTHNKGDLMFSYRYVHMNMGDLKDGNNDIAFEEALLPNGGSYMVTPTKMPMNMHMLGAMYAVSNKTTLMAMFNYMSSEMEHLTAAGGSFTTEAAGFGDVKISALHKFFNKNRQQLHGDLGISLPTGSIDVADVTPASSPKETILPYPMQIGSGTVDGTIGLTYLGQANTVSWGSQLKGVIRFSENSNHYKLGNRYALNSWFAVKAANWLSFSAKAEGLVVGEILGSNPDLNPVMVTTADTTNSGGTFLNAGLGFNAYISNGALKNVRFGFEVAIPVYQNLNGIQLKQKETLTFGLQYSL